MPAERLTQLIVEIRQALSGSELQFLRRGSLDLEWRATAERLLGDEGGELVAELRRAKHWKAETLRQFAAQRALIAHELARAELAPEYARFAQDDLYWGSQREAPLRAVASISREPNAESRHQRSEALADASLAFAPRLVEVRSEASRAFARWTRRDVPSEPEPNPAALSPIAGPAAPEPVAPPLDMATLASELLEATDDAARDMVRWSVRELVPRGSVPWHALLHTLRAVEFDGLARPRGRLRRLSAGLHALGFERDMSARMRAEQASLLLRPGALVLPRAIPADVRVVESSFEAGTMSDLLSARAIGEALALALTSPALPELARWPVGPGIAATHGWLLMQLRAEPGYLLQVDAVDPLAIEQLARHTGVIALLELRLRAALTLAARSVTRDGAERLAQLTAALERALQVVLPAGFAAFAYYHAAPDGNDLEAAAAGFALHVGLRERFDEDWYRNPRVAEVIRGACARGNTLSPAMMCEEFGGAARRVGAPRDRATRLTSALGAAQRVVPMTDRR